MIKNNLSIIVPAYNEGKCITKNVDTIIKQMKGWNLEIVVVNDGSTDDTADKILKLCNKYRGIVKVVSYTHNVGKGYAVYSGIELSKHPQKLIIDADLSVMPEHLKRFRDMDMKLEAPYIIKGQRYQVQKQPWYRIAVGKGWQMLVWIMTGINMDTQCPFTYLNVPDRFYAEMVIDGFAFDVEIIYKATMLGMEVIEVDVPYFNDKDSKVTLKKTYQMFKDLLKIRRKAF
jgi:glycosyltransferase involved in cell wall biosynthesis